MRQTPTHLIDYSRLPDGRVKVEGGKLVHDPTGGGGSTYREPLVASGVAPPVQLTSSDDTDYLYGSVTA